MTSMTSLYERILALVPVDELQESYNSVLQEDISSVDDAVNDVISAFAKLEELREVVNGLQQRQTMTGGHSATLLEVLDTTMILQQSMEKTLQKIDKGMVENTKRREYPKHDLDGTKAKRHKLHTSSDESTALKEALNGKLVLSAIKSKTEVATSVARIGNLPGCIEQFVREVDALFLHQRVDRIPEFLQALSESVKLDKRGLLRLEVYKSLRFVVAWANQSAGQLQSLRVYRAFERNAALYANELPKSKEKPELQRKINGLAKTLDFLGAVPNGDVHLEAATAEKKLDDISNLAILVRRVCVLPFKERKERVVEVLTAFKTTMTGKLSARDTRRITKCVHAVVLWMINDPPDSSSLDTYREMSELLRVTLARSSAPPNPRLSQLHETMLKWLAGKRSITRPEAAELGKRTAAVQTIIRTWQLDAVARVDVTAVMTEIETIVRSPIIGWNPRENLTLCECAAEMEKHIMRLKDLKIRQICVTSQTSKHGNRLALYERLLRLIPVAELQGGCNEVPKEEIASINHAIDGVTDAFAKVEGIREAVRKLGNGSTGSRSASLLEVMDSTMKLQQELQEKLKVVIGTGKDVDTDRKRKRTEESSSLGSGDIHPGRRATSSRLASSVVDSTSGSNSLPIQPVAATLEKRRKLHDERKTASDSKAEDTKVEQRKAVSPETIVADRKTDQATCKAGSVSIRHFLWARNVSNDGSFNSLKKFTALPNDERNACIPNVLGKLAETMPRRAISYQIKMVQHVTLWTQLIVGQTSLYHSFRKFAESIEKLNKTTGEAGVMLSRAQKNLSKLLGTLDSQGKVPERSSGSRRVAYHFLMLRVKYILPADRNQHIPEVIAELLEEMSKAASGTEDRMKKLSKAVSTAASWALDDAKDSSQWCHQLRRLYSELAKKAKCLASKVPYLVTKAFLLRAVRKLEAALGKTRASEATMESQASDALRWTTSSLTNALSFKDFEKAILMVDELVRHKEDGWMPRQNDAVLRCYMLLKGRSFELEDDVARLQCEKLMKKWSLDRVLDKRIRNATHHIAQRS